MNSHRSAHAWFTNAQPVHKLKGLDIAASSARTDIPTRGYYTVFVGKTNMLVFGVKGFKHQNLAPQCNNVSGFPMLSKAPLSFNRRALLVAEFQVNDIKSGCFLFTTGDSNYFLLIGSHSESI